MAERMGGTNDQKHQERRWLVLEALQEDRQRTAARLVRDLHRQRTGVSERRAWVWPRGPRSRAAAVWCVRSACRHGNPESRRRPSWYCQIRTLSQFDAGFMGISVGTFFLSMKPLIAPSGVRCR